MAMTGEQETDARRAIAERCVNRTLPDVRKVFEPIAEALAKDDAEARLFFRMFDWETLRTPIAVAVEGELTLDEWQQLAAWATDPARLLGAAIGEKIGAAIMDAMQAKLAEVTR